MFLPPLLSCDELSFPLEVILLDWVFIWEHLMYVLVTNLRVPPMNLCIGVGTCSWLSGSSFGALFEALLCWLDESEIVDAYRIIMPTDTWGDNGVSRWH